ncbi:MAG: alpha/beta hydrolase fold domain-containing protein [Pseudomonadota bacterium]
MTLDIASTAFLAQMALAGAPPLHEMSPEEARLVSAGISALQPPGPEMASVQDVEITSENGGSFRARVLKPVEAPRAVLVYYHGGGWVIGDIDGFDTLGRLLAERTGAAVVLVDYRKAPEHRFPTAVDDAWDAVKWVDANMSDIAGARVPILVGGDSAGGNLAAVVAQRAKRAGGLDIALQILVYPVTDAAMDRDSYIDTQNQLLLTSELMTWFWDHYAPDAADRASVEASPLRADDLAGLPPAIMLLAEYDVLRDEGEAYAEKLRVAGVPVTLKVFERQMHNFFAMPGLLPGAGMGLDFVGEQVDRFFAERSEVDVVVVGAGFAGMYQLHRLRELGLRTRVIEAGDGVGGTWYWNRYPGARCDIESLAYSYGFSPELEQDWQWSEKYATQPEILRYAEHVADRFDLRRDMTFGTRVTRAAYDESAGRWMVHTDTGEAISAQYLIMATGCLSAPKVPDIPGAGAFDGPTYQTGRWPHEEVDFTGLRVGVIGTGSSAVQSIPLIAEQAAQLTVYQRTPAFSQPAFNRPLGNAEVSDMKERYRDYRAAQRLEAAGIPNPPRGDVSVFEVGEEEREASYEAGYQSGLLTALSGAYTDVLTDKAANDTVVDFLHRKIREKVDDPDTAEALTPRAYPFATKRPCLDTNYYETFNRDNVRLVDLRKTPIETITKAGVRTSAGEDELDALIFATGFDAMTGAILNVDIIGVDGASLRDKWAGGPRTYLGLCVAGFPNLFTITGPSSPSVLSNMLVSIEQHVDWITDCLKWMGERGLSVIEPTEAAEEEWTAHADQVANMTLFPEADSWYTGANVPGKTKTMMVYTAGVGVYRIICDQIAAAGYEGFRTEPAQVAAAAE